MVKKDLVSRTTELLHERDVRKPVSIPKRKFYISNEEGKTASFPVKEEDKLVMYTKQDVEAILDACIQIILDALKHGEEIVLHGIGRLCLRYHKDTKVKNVLNGEYMDVKGHYYPKLIFGNDLKRCAQVYEQSMADSALLKQTDPIWPEEDE